VKILVTGARGSVGKVLCPTLRELGHKVVQTDISETDATAHAFLEVTSRRSCEDWLEKFRPEVVIHLAGFKQAPDGELAPHEVVRINTTGTHNVTEAAKRVGARVILASTCKAADPETAYGASKLIAERIVLNAGGTVARFYNVREAGGNVFETWAAIPPEAPIPYTDCTRYFISMKQAVELLVRCLILPPGRYTVDPGKARVIRMVARELYPNRNIVAIPRRRGDRQCEPLVARSEEVHRLDRELWQILSPHDV
jgi:FlaA1/EpsC-like NDP-sugar epimerase